MFLKSLKILPIILTFGFISDSSATSVFNSATSVSFNAGNIDSFSYDGAGFNTLSAYKTPVPTSFNEYSSFDGGANGTQYEIFFLSSVADYKNQNTFGLLNEQNQFVSSINGANAFGSKVSFTQAAGQKLKFGFQSPESLFFSKSNENKDGGFHLLSLTATANSLFTIPKADQQGHSFAFNLLAGDFVFFADDQLQDTHYNGAVKRDSDFNDGTFVVRAKPVEVPEPGTICLLGLGALAAVRRRKVS